MGHFHFFDTTLNLCMTGNCYTERVKPEPPLKPDWKDFLALVIAAYQVLLVPVLAMIGALLAVVLGLGLFFD